MKSTAKSKVILPKININGVKSQTVNYENGSKHLLVEGSSIEVLRQIPDGTIDLIFTDPPYNANINYGDTYRDNLSLDSYLNTVREWVAEYKRILSDKGTLYFMNYPELNARILPILSDEMGLKYQNWITWHYPSNIGHSKRKFTRSHRSILFYTKTDKYTFNKDAMLQPYKNPNVGKIKRKIEAGSRGRGAYDALNPYDLAEMLYSEYTQNHTKPIVRPDISDNEVIYMNLLKNVSKDRLNKLHPCQLPLELIRRFIAVSSNEGDVILDPFSGTFTTGLASATLNRNSVGIEINPEYVKLGKKRFQIKD